MQDISGKSRTIQELLSEGSYGVDYYQREYTWGRKQLQELIDDLTGCFFDNYEEEHGIEHVEKYGYYFLGSIVVSQQKDHLYIVDGQQRLTSLLILLIYLNNLQQGQEKKADIKPLIRVKDYGKRKFKLDIPERQDCMNALFDGNGEPFNDDDASDSVRNIRDRYHDLDELFPEALREDLLQLFFEWVRHKVKIIEITAYADEDAYTIFETMNDRGLSLTPTEMLRGYLLSKIDDPEKRFEADKIIKKYLVRFAEYGKETEADFFKAWIRSQYAKTIRDRKKDAKPKDFDLIGTEYHRWVRDHGEKKIELKRGDDFYLFVKRDFKYFARLYLLLLDAAHTRKERWESIKYNADAGFTLQHHLTLATVTPNDSDDIAAEKIGIAADFLDIWLNLRFWNSKSNDYSTMQYAVYRLITKILRGKTPSELRQALRQHLCDEIMKEINFSKPVILNQFTSKAIHRQLARFTDWLEQQSNEPGNYEEYIVRSGKNAYEIEHIWADQYRRFKNEFDEKTDFDLVRNQIGGLLLLPKKVNASLSDKTYEEKLPTYCLKGTVLAQSLREEAYKNNPGFLQTIKKHGLPFKPHAEFTKSDLEKRSALYCQLAKLIWSPDRL